MKSNKEKTQFLERQAFNYSVLADVSRVVNNFMILEDFFNFALELLTEYTGRIQGILLLYAPDARELSARASRLYQLSDNLTLIPAFDEKAGLITLQVENPTLIEHKFPHPKLLSHKEFLELLEMFPALARVVDLYGMKEAIVLVHRGEFKGMALLGDATKYGTTGEIEKLGDFELLVPLADLLSTSIENVVLREPAVLDSLSGAYTNRYFLTLLEQHLESALTRGEDGVLLMVDIDSFKNINDTFGHLAGDKVIQGVTAILKENTRDKLDFVGRYGGDEFLVFLSATDVATAYSVANRIRASVAQERFKNVGSVSVSVGVSEGAQKAQTAGRLLESADKALYHAKASGGNVVALANDELQGIGVDASHTAYQRHIKDRITAFYSGPYFLGRVDGEMKRARRYGHAVSIVAMGISRISRLRYALRREEVEKIFRILSNVVLQTLRTGIDLPGRFANEYILFLLPETNQESAEKFVKRLMEQLENLWFPVQDQAVAMKFSAGIASFRKDHEEPAQFIGDAIEALEESQHLGEGQVLAFNPERNA